MRLVRIGEVMEITGLGRRTIYDAIERGEFPSRSGSRAMRLRGAWRKSSNGLRRERPRGRPALVKETRTMP